MHQRVNLGERVMVFIPNDQTKSVEFYRYSLTEMSEVFSRAELVCINGLGRTKTSTHNGVWVDAIYASCRLAERVLA
jgi:hypothetical protein